MTARTLTFCLLPLVVLLSCGWLVDGTASRAQTGKETIYTPQEKNTQSITPLGSDDEQVPKPSKEAIELLDHMNQLDNMNQCAGTVQHYRLPPTGYVAAPQTPDSEAGKKLFEKLNCASCHQITGKGGTLGPPLDGIGGHRGEQFIAAHMLDPEKQMKEFPDVFGGRPNIMPHPNVTTDDAKLIAQYLLTLPEPGNGFLITAHPPIKIRVHKSGQANVQKSVANAQSVKQGRDLFFKHGCAACHTVDSSPSKFGPRLDGISKRADRQTVEEEMRGGADFPEMDFRTFHLTTVESNHIIDFIMQLPPARAKH